MGSSRTTATGSSRTTGGKPSGPTAGRSPGSTGGRSSRPTGRRPSRASPWHREPLVWMVLAIPATAVVVGVVMLVLANVTWDGLVADDYYRRGMEINRSLARDAEAARLGLRASVAFPAPGVVEVRLLNVDDGTSVAAGPRLDLRFARASRAGTDVEVSMNRDTGGAWRGALPALPAGKWYAELGNEQWRLAGVIWMPVPPTGFVLHSSDAKTPNSNSS